MDDVYSASPIRMIIFLYMNLLPNKNAETELCGEEQNTAFFPN
jgi:hypothetical protein